MPPREAKHLVRQLIDKVVLIPDANAPDGVQLELHGALAEILALCAGERFKAKLPGAAGPGSQVSVVAGERNHRQLTLPPVTV